VPAIYFPYGFCTNKGSYCSNFLALYLQVYASQEVETLAVHSLFTIQNTEAIKRNVRKWRVYAQRVTYVHTYGGYVCICMALLKCNVAFVRE